MLMVRFHDEKREEEGMGGGGRAERWWKFLKGRGEDGEGREGKGRRMTGRMRRSMK